MSNNSGLFGPWEIWRKLGAGLAVALGGFLAVLVSLPLGPTALLTFILCAYLWKPFGVTNPKLGTYVIDTLPYKIALFFMAYRIRVREVLSPVIALGFGPPTTDQDHNLEAGWWPVTRLSSYWSLLGAFLLALLDIPMANLRSPFWGDVTLPGWACSIISLAGWFALIQSILAIRRIQADKTGIVGFETAPAVMLSHVHTQVQLSSKIGQSFAIGSIPAFILLVLWIAFGLPFYIMLPAIAFSLFFVSFVSISRIFMTAYREKWSYRNERRQFWEGVLSFKKDKAPILLNEAELPTYEEWERTNQDPESPYAPEVKIATFIYPPNCNYDDYVGNESRIQGDLEASLCSISPIGEVEQEGKEVSGTIGSRGLRIWWTDSLNVNVWSILDPELDNWKRELLVRGIVLPAISGIRGHGHCTLVSFNMMTRKRSKHHILEVKMRPPANVNISTFLSTLNAITQAIGLPWARAYQEDVESGSSVVTLMVGEHPNNEGVRFVNPPSLVKRTIDIADWMYYFYVNNVAGATGAPKLLSRRSTTSVVDELEFELPGGLAYKSIVDKIPSIKTTSGNAFLETTLGSTNNDDSSLSMKEKVEQESKSSTRFTVIAAREDPLSRVFEFDSYRDQILTGREPGVAKINWTPGPFANDELAVYDWEKSELPHLLIAGASGTGKSVIGNSMLCQIAYNNGPEDVRFRLVEPKNELQQYQHLDIVDRYVDSWTPDTDFYENVADMCEDTYELMMQRNKLMNDHPKQPKKLAKAREIAAREGPSPDGTPHPLDLPYVFLTIEECAAVLADALTKDDKEAQARILFYLTKLSQMSRNTGIFLVALTQYPTNASIPSIIRNNMRRIGLGCQNSMASRVVIDQNGLEEIRTKGAGLITAEMGSYRKFRGLWLKDGDLDYGEQNDTLDIISQLPSNGTGQRSWSNPSPLVIPSPDDTVYHTWNRSTGILLDRAIDEGRKTKDVSNV